MKKILIIILIVVGSIVILFNLQTDVHVQRFAVIDAPVEVVRLEVTDFRKFVKWNPWSSIDPNVVNEFSKVQGEIGAKYSWTGDDRVGIGSQEVLSIQPNRVDIKLTVTSPWQSESIIYYELVPTDRGTTLTWGYSGKIAFLVDLMQDMDDVLGKQFEVGLKTLQDKYRK